MIEIRTISLKLTVALVFVLTVFITILIYVLTISHRNELLREKTYSTYRLAETLRKSIGYFMLHENRDGIEESFKAVAGQKDIASVRLLKVKILSCQAEAGDPRGLGEMEGTDNLGSELCRHCHTSEDPSLTLNPLVGSRVFKDSLGRRVLSITNVIHNEESCSSVSCHQNPSDQAILGFLKISLSLQEMDQRQTRSTAAVIGVVFGFLGGLCLFIGLLVYRFVRRPIKSLLKGVHQVSAGDFGYKIPVPSVDEIGELTVAYNDMTDQVRYHVQKLTESQEQLFHAEKLASLGKMAAGVAHELNSPLTAILNDSSLLLRDAPEGSVEQEDLKVIVSETKRCGKIISGLLEFTRLQGPEKNARNLNDILHETLNLVKHQAVLHDIELSVSLALDLPAVNIDANQIKQVFLDIITNAIHAIHISDFDGRLHILTRFDEEKNSVVADFIDTGCGIDEDNLQKIFDPFFTTKDAGRGTGLGLAICYELIQKHGGKVEVTSTVGKGTTFSVMIPAIREA